MRGKENAREVALRTLIACERQGGWSDGVLKRDIREAGLDTRDAALATRLCFGVLQNRMLCDFYIDQFSTVKTKKMEDRVLAGLRIGVYQLLFLDKIPVSAAVNESVSLVRRYAKNPRAAGLVNGVLRTISRNRTALPEPPGLSVRYSHPQWLVNKFLKRLPEKEAEALLAENNTQPETTIQLNPMKASMDQLEKALRESGAHVSPHPWIPDCLTISGAGDLENLEPFRKGWFYVQDGAAKLAVLAAKPQPGITVLDACAAPGGKSFGVAIAMGDRGSVTACDIHPHKRKLLEAGAARLGLSIVHPSIQDSGTPREDFDSAFDLVIADVPCSGLGVIRKKPDIRYKDEEPLTQLPRIQRRILETVSGYVKPGGTLLYSTCTLLERENEEVVSAFLETHPNFSLEPFSLPGPIGRTEGQITIWPQRYQLDGFFIARMRRRP